MNESHRGEPQGETQPVFKAVVITDPGQRKISLIKILRQTAGVDLVEAKRLAEHPVPFVLVACDEETARALATQLTVAGATCLLDDYDESVEPAIPNDHPIDLTRRSQSGCATPAALLLAAGSAGLYGFAHLVMSLV